MRRFYVVLTSAHNLCFMRGSRGGGGQGVRTPVDFLEYGFCNGNTLSDLPSHLGMGFTYSGSAHVF